MKFDILLAMIFGALIVQIVSILYVHWCDDMKGNYFSHSIGRNMIYIMLLVYSILQLFFK